MMRNLGLWCGLLLAVCGSLENCDGGAIQAFSTKNWHSPYDPKKASSQFFQVLDWVTVQEMQVGMPVARLKELGMSVLEPYGNADALLFSYAPGKMEYEVELKFSKQRIADISFRAVDRSERGEKGDLDVPISMQMASPTPAATPTDVHLP